MKINELQVGDFVLNNHEVCRVYCIESPLPRKDKIFDNKSIITLLGRGMVSVPIEDIEPIPLTDEILELNGWKQQIVGGLKVWERPEFRLHIDLNDSVGSNNFKYNYVHELQHALTLCGLHRLADNFKM